MGWMSTVSRLHFPATSHFQQPGNPRPRPWFPKAWNPTLARIFVLIPSRAKSLLCKGAEFLLWLARDLLQQTPRERRIFRSSNSFNKNSVLSLQSNSCNSCTLSERSLLLNPKNSVTQHSNSRNSGNSNSNLSYLAHDWSSSVHKMAAKVELKKAQRLCRRHQSREKAQPSESRLLKATEAKSAYLPPGESPGKSGLPRAKHCAQEGCHSRAPGGETLCFLHRTGRIPPVHEAQDIPTGPFRRSPSASIPAMVPEELDSLTP